MKTSLIASIMIALAFTPVAWSGNVPVELALNNELSGRVHFEVDGKYSCDALGTGTYKPYVCVFATDCGSAGPIGYGVCIQADLDSGLHTVIVTWGGQRISRQVKVKYMPYDPDPDFGNPEMYFSYCTLSPVPAFGCDD